VKTDRVDTLLRDGPILTMDPQHGLIPCGYVAVHNGRIAAVGACQPGEKLPFASMDTVSLAGRLLMPGLVNAHTHAAMTIFRGLADDLQLMDWLTHYIFPVEKQLTADWVLWGTKLACLEMIRSGTTTFCDMYLFEQAAAEAVDEAGMRALVGEVLYDFPSPNYGPPAAGLAYTRELIERWQGHPRVSIAVEPHAPYTCSPELLRLCNDLASQYDVPLVIHLAESAYETEDIQKRYGARPVAHLDRLGLLHSRLIADHVVHVNAAEIARLAEAGVRVVHNPESNMKLASGCAPVSAMLRQGVTLALGTDGCASNNNLDMFQEMDTAAKLEKVMVQDPTVMPARAVLEMATLGGARALGLEDRIGSLTADKEADLIVLDFEQPHLTPVYDYVSHVVYCVRGADVLSTMVAGRWLMCDRNMLALDEEPIFARVADIAAKVRQIVKA